MCPLVGVEAYEGHKATVVVAITAVLATVMLATQLATIASNPSVVLCVPRPRWPFTGLPKARIRCISDRCVVATDASVTGH